ncbi:Cell number regulator 5 [Hibiscus syriacus]|uniref:Cell number regulator 5 n=1 Tax=Hibiscus syriacus TaxID=106335 RepID=A0A6A3BCJ6_HIBSY|nr:Cell number regulator 5 [Hibiscus syriacus]
MENRSSYVPPLYVPLGQSDEENLPRPVGEVDAEPRPSPPQSQSVQWSSGICACCDDMQSCLLFPCYLFGKNAEFLVLASIWPCLDLDALSLVMLVAIEGHFAPDTICRITSKALNPIKKVTSMKWSSSLPGALSGCKMVNKLGSATSYEVSRWEMVVLAHKHLFYSPHLLVVRNDRGKLDRSSLFFTVRLRLAKWFLAKYPLLSIQMDSLIGDPSMADNISAAKDLHRVVCWSPPPVGFFKLNVDGAVTSVGLLAGIGGILRDWNRNKLMSFSEKVGPTPILAELKAIKRGLDLFLSSEWVLKGKLIIESDCKLAVEWIG